VRDAAGYSCNEIAFVSSFAEIRETSNRRVGATHRLRHPSVSDILIIEDDEILRDLVADWLKLAGYQVRVAVDGRAGLAAVDDHPPALVVTDICMPGAGGASVIAEIKRTYPTLPVIAISARFRCRQGLAPEEAIALGAARALAKPFKRSEMVAAVADLVGSPRA